MTKEKPIGLIVGLFFIIVFGLILSELTGTNATCPPPPSAEEENVGAYNPTPTIDDYVPYNPAPLAPPRAGVLGTDALVDVRMSRPSADDRGGIIEAELRPEAALLAATQAPTGVVDSYMPESTAPAHTARAAGGTIYVGPGGVSSEHLVGPAAAVQAQTKTYIVESGDTLTRIARKFYGAGNEREYKRIFAANRDTMRTESSLSIGQELTIPPLSLDIGATSDRSATGTTDGGLAGRSGNGRYVTVSLDDLPGALSGINRRPEPSPAPAPAVARTYVVQRGDNLTSIARRLMRDDSIAAVRKLFEANRDILPSRNRLQVGMELRLPG